MRTRAGAESIESRGATTWNDWFDPIDGARVSDGSITKAQDPGVGTGGTGGRGEDAVSQASGPDSLSECKDGVCPVPWATAKEEIAPGVESKITFSVIEDSPVIQEETVNHPSHYTDGAIECIEAIEAQLTAEEYRGYLKGNIAKYVWREKLKGSTESLKKARWYLDRLIQLDEIQNG